jgi:hypothetical protein
MFSVAFKAAMFILVFVMRVLCIADVADRFIRHTSANAGTLDVLLNSLCNPIDGFEENTYDRALPRWSI